MKSFSYADSSRSHSALFVIDPLDLPSHHPCTLQPTFRHHSEVIIKVRRDEGQINV